jgi:pyruvate dehydrogenase E2 component (dihydrolipoamide acetyltransferase)
MALSVVMPALEMAQETGTLVAWLKKEGEHVRKGEMLLEVETDKAVVEIEAAGDGLLAGISAKAGDVIPVGRTIAWLLQPGESAPRETAVSTPTGRRSEASPVTRQPSFTPQFSTAPASSVAGVVSGVAPAGRARMSPKARRLAQEYGVDVGSVTGSGPGGEVLADDILAAARTGAEPVSSVGRLMAERTTESWTSVPHFFVTREVDATALKAARKALVPSVERAHGVRLTHTDLLVAAVGRALRTHPRVNASWTTGGISLHQEVNVALAMAVEHAVVTAVVRGADAAAIGEIAARRRDLADRACAGRLQPADITGATFTISNLGMYEVDAFTAIIVPPQAGILAVGAIVDRVVAVGGEVAIRPMMMLTLSADHRVVDGASAAAFLADVVAAIREPGPWLSTA